MSFDITDHALDDVVNYIGAGVEISCSCSNPDSTGDGLVRFTGDTIADLVFQWHDHINQLQTASDPHLPKLISVTDDKVTFDGTPLPYFIARDPMAIELEPGGYSTVTLTFLTEHVEVDFHGPFTPPTALAEAMPDA